MVGGKDTPTSANKSRALEAGGRPRVRLRSSDYTATARGSQAGCFYGNAQLRRTLPSPFAGYQFAFLYSKLNYVLHLTEMKRFRERILRVVLNVVRFCQRTISEASLGDRRRRLIWGRGGEALIPGGHAAGPRLSLFAILEPLEVRGAPGAEFWGQIIGVGSAIYLGQALVRLGGSACQ